MLRVQGLRDFSWVPPELTGVNYRPRRVQNSNASYQTGRLE
jgi:hypothetical protein